MRRQSARLIVLLIVVLLAVGCVSSGNPSEYIPVSEDPTEARWLEFVNRRSQSELNSIFVGQVLIEGLPTPYMPDNGVRYFSSAASGACKTLVWSFSTNLVLGAKIISFEKHQKDGVEITLQPFVYGFRYGETSNSWGWYVLEDGSVVDDCLVDKSRGTMKCNPPPEGGFVADIEESARSIPPCEPYTVRYALP